MCGTARPPPPRRPSSLKFGARRGVAPPAPLSYGPRIEREGRYEVPAGHEDKPREDLDPAGIGPQLRLRSRVASPERPRHQLEVLAQVEAHEPQTLPVAVDDSRRGQGSVPGDDLGVLRGRGPARPARLEPPRREVAGGVERREVERGDPGRRAEVELP